MNRIYKFKSLLLLLFLFGLASCGESFLDSGIDRDHTPETIVTDRNTIWQFANAMYAPIQYGFSELDDNIFAAATDEAQQTATSADAFVFNKGILSPTNNPIEGRYTACYEGIRAANFFLDYVSDKKGEKLLAYKRDTIRDVVNYERDKRYLNYTRAEAQVLKAFYYSELLKMYGGVPIVETIYKDEPDKRYTRSSYDEVVSYAIELIESYENDLAPNWNEDKNRGGRFTLAVAKAIKSRLLLYAASPLNNPTDDKSKWIAAAKAADDIITHPDFSFTLDNNYGSYFAGQRPLISSETIYVVRSDQSNNPERKNYPVATQGGNSGVTPTHNFVKQYEQLKGIPESSRDIYFGKDPRLEATVVVNGSNWNGRIIDQSPGERDDQNNTNASRTGYYLKKFLGENLNLVQDQKTQHNWVVYRYAEILLNYAEAMNEAYGPDDAGEFSMTAREALQLVRDRASTDLPDITATSDAEFRDVVKHERMIELAFEGHRYWDLLRWKDAEEALNKPVTGVKVTKDALNQFVYTEQVVATREFHKEKNYRMPFSRAEIVNSQGGLEQNEGYE